MTGPGPGSRGLRALQADGSRAPAVSLTSRAPATPAGVIRAGPAAGDAERAVFRPAYREHGHGGAVPPGSDRGVSINLAGAAPETPRLAGHRHSK